ncbi:SH3 domain-containing protein [Sphingomonas sp. SORGH_AS_0879]|uniref:SH3 domain-containing protein n=1 Tax=Sphingomonas sp. SORGH_AS_0879 TaxID=3041790 RepID=UPI00278A04DD|nr:SH3 domain-containing protein [Sphingomonas sp. SORGH_AS_0879]MDQ1229756.1 SH3-like domain-containing protein [Sphingomonas sp. SORGH_AS_0879]
MRRSMIGLALLSVMLSAGPIAPAATAAPEKRAMPYYGSIGASVARMRTGPARTYPASWTYRRADLPVKIVAAFKEWRKVQDPDGTEGWMLAVLLRNTRTAIVRGTDPLPMRSAPTENAKTLWRAAPGVVGRISECNGGWCRLDVKGQAGFVPVGAIWGVEPGEVVP